MLPATLWVACALVIAERVGKAVRSPAKDTLLSHATSATGRGRGFAVHEALDQVGAVIGPLTVAAVLALTGGDYAPALGVLALPGAATLALLVWLRLRVPEPASYEPGAARAHPTRGDAGRFAGGVLAVLRVRRADDDRFHDLRLGVVSPGQPRFAAAAAVPVLYAAAMVADALAALASGWCYDRFGGKVLFALPILSAAVAVFAFAGNVPAVVAGALLWGAAVGIQESTLRAVVADLVAPGRRASAYGAFAAALGGAAAAGGALTGWLYDVSVHTLMASIVGIQLLALTVGGVSKVCSGDNRRQSSHRHQTDISQ